jgi:hypothetical protein
MDKTDMFFAIIGSVFFGAMAEAIVSNGQPGWEMALGFCFMVYLAAGWTMMDFD